MIPIERLHYRLDMKLNKVASNAHQQIPVEDKDLVIGEAQMKLIKGKLGTNNGYGEGFDSFRKRYQDLEFLVVPHESHKPRKDRMPVSSHSLELSSLKSKFLMPVDIYMYASRGDCKERIVTVERIARHSDIPVLLAGSDTRPSFDYQATLAVISSGSLIVYSDDFSVDELYISYLRYPRPVCFGDYEDFDGNLQTRVDCELPEHLEDELIEIAVRDLALMTENQTAAQASVIRGKEGE